MENFTINTNVSEASINGLKAHNALNEIESTNLIPTVKATTGDIVNFKSEFNIGLALPFEFCKNKKTREI